MKFTDQIRRAVRNSELSQYALCKMTGINKAAMSRFVNGKTGIGCEYLDLIADALGLQIVVNKAKRKDG